MTKIALHSINILLLGWFKICETNGKKCAQFVVVDSFNSEWKVEKAMGVGGVHILNRLCITLSRPIEANKLITTLNKIDAHKGSLGFPAP